LSCAIPADRTAFDEKRGGKEVFGGRGGKKGQLGALSSHSGPSLGYNMEASCLERGDGRGGRGRSWERRRRRVVIKKKPLNR